MCDTHVVLGPYGAWFAKNSDREPSEPQYMEYHPAVENDAAEFQKCSYISVKQVSERAAYFLSRPSWLWGGEMGVNKYGVAIGNQAVFTKTRSLKRALAGMDLVRLGLQRSKDATEALEVITALLEKHGQGGPMGFRNKNTRYDNSFLIADHQRCWKLETAGRNWVAKEYRHSQNANIAVTLSNRLTIHDDYDRCSDALLKKAKELGYWNGQGDFSFAKTFESRPMTKLSGAKGREKSNQKQLQTLCQQPLNLRTDWADFAQMLRHHKLGTNAHAADGNNEDSCMHAGGLIRRSQTTASMIVHLQEDDIRAAATGTSAPCLSLFRPLSFDSEHWSVLNQLDNHNSLWHEQEPIHRRAIFNDALKSSIQGDIALTEHRIFKALNASKTTLATELGKADICCMEWQQRQLARAEHLPLQTEISAYGYYWRRLNKKDHIS